MDPRALPKIALVLVALVGLGGCNRLLFDSQREVMEELQGLDRPGEYLPDPATDPNYLREGSLWQTSSAGATLFTDSKARRVNDIVTILVSESSQASKAATTETTREARMEADISQFFGLEQRYAARNDFFDPTAIIRANAVNDFKGEGATTRNDQLTGTMTAVVQRVLPNGNLVIKGRRVVAVNDESQYMVLTGIIRPEDISPENAIASSLVADARITYHGVGVVSDKQSNGWASKIFDWIWPL